jgi:hypothetical protein
LSGPDTAITYCNEPNPLVEPPKFTFHQQIEEDIVNGFIDSID